MSKEYETLEKLCKDTQAHKVFDIYTNFVRKYRIKHNEEYHSCTQSDEMEAYFKKREDVFMRYIDRYYLKPIYEGNKQ